MPSGNQLKSPWLLAVWPGMGGVAITAGYYLMAKLGMHLLLEIPAGEFFEREEIEVKDGLIQTRRLPRSRLFHWSDPRGEHDLIVFIGEAQPPSRGGAFCRQLIGHAKELGVVQVFTFAAMATPMRPVDNSRVFGAAVDRDTLAKFRQLDVHMLEGGNISGLNGSLLAIAAENGLPGGCLLGEIPHVFSQIPFPKASLAVLEFFTVMAGIDLDFGELRTQADTVERTLEDFLVRMENSIESKTEESRQSVREKTHLSPPRQSAKDRKQIEDLFENASKDRSRAFELKQELDRLGLFSEYEDRFLDLFKEP